MSKALKETMIKSLESKLEYVLSLTTKAQYRPEDFKNYMQSIVFITEAIKNINKMP